METVRPTRAVRRSARRVVPRAILQADSRAEEGDLSMAVSEDDTPKYSLPKLPSCNDFGGPYALLMGFGERLEAARKSAGVTGADLGVKLGVSKQTISHWENGRHEPSIEQIKALCAVLDVTPNWLMEMSAPDLSADAFREARAYDALSPENKRRWRTMRLTMFAPA